MNAFLQKELEASLERIATELRQVGDVAAHLETDRLRVGVEIVLRIRADDSRAYAIRSLGLPAGVPAQTRWTELPRSPASDEPAGTAH